MAFSVDSILASSMAFCLASANLLFINLDTSKTLKIQDVQSEQKRQKVRSDERSTIARNSTFANFCILFSKFPSKQNFLFSISLELSFDCWINCTLLLKLPPTLRRRKKLFPNHGSVFFGEQIAEGSFPTERCPHNCKATRRFWLWW